MIFSSQKTVKFSGSPVDSGGLWWTPSGNESTSLRKGESSWSPVDSGELKSSGVHWTSSENESTSLRKGESTGVQGSPTGLCGGG